MLRAHTSTSPPPGGSIKSVVAIFCFVCKFGECVCDIAFRFWWWLRAVVCFVCVSNGKNTHAAHGINIISY